MTPCENCKIYIAGPLSQGDVERNVRRAIDAAQTLVALGYVPFVPHLNHFWHQCHPRTREAWLAYDHVWLLVCDAVLRLPGPSDGADGEVALARAHGIPVYTSLEALLAAAGLKENA